MKCKAALIICCAVMITLSSCSRRVGNPTVDGNTVWENSAEEISSQYDMSETYNLNYNVADALNAHSQGVDAEQVRLAESILDELEKYPDYSDDKDLNYIIKLRNVYKCTVGFYYMNSTYDGLNALIAEYDSAYAELSDNSKTMYMRISNSQFQNAAEQFEQYGISVTNS